MTTKLIDPHHRGPTLNELWHAETTCRVGYNIRIAKCAGWVVIEKHGNGLFQDSQPYSTFNQALIATQGKTLKEDRSIL